MNECIPKYEPGQDLTGHVSQGGGVVGCRFLALVADKQGVEAVSDGTTGGNVVVGYPAAGGRVFGVAGYDAADGKKVKIVRGRGKVVPVLTAGAIAFDTDVQVDTVGRVVTYVPATLDGNAGNVPSKKPVGRTIRAAADATFALIELY